MSEKPVVNPYVAILAGVVAVSFSALFVRLSSAPPLITAAYRLLFTFLLVAPYTLIRHRRELFAMKRRELLFAGVSGVFLALHFATWFTSLNYTTIASSVVIVTTQPVFVVIGSWLFFRERISRLGVIGGCLALCGSFIIGAGDFRLGMAAFYGDLLALLAAILVSGYMIIGRKIRSSVSLSAYTFVVLTAVRPLCAEGVAPLLRPCPRLHRRRPYHLQLGHPLCAGVHGCRQYPR